ncbi:MAG: response regulator [Planctomycetes bacterium]|nr:response regulator [Planctomycetota bacterium]
MLGWVVERLQTATPTAIEAVRFRGGLKVQRQQADLRIFWLLLAQWGGILLASFVMASHWDHSRLSSLSFLVVAVGLLSLLPLAMVLQNPGSWRTRWSVAAAQGLLSILLWKTAGGRPDTYLHLCAWLIVMSLYRDVPVLLATVGIALSGRGLIVATGALPAVSVIDATNCAWLVCLLGETAFVLTFIVLDRQALATQIGKDLALQSLQDSFQARIDEITRPLVEERDLLQREVAALKAQRSASDAARHETSRELTSLRRDLASQGQAVLMLASLPANSLPSEWRSHWQLLRQQLQQLLGLVELPSMVPAQDSPGTSPHLQVTRSEQISTQNSDRSSRALLMLRNPVQQARAVLTLERAGYTVDVTSNGPRTYYSVMLNDYSLIIVDIDLPGDEGFDTIEALRLLPPDRLAPVNCLFALTSERTADRVLRSTSLGVDGILLKPLKIDGLRQANVLSERASRVAGRAEWVDSTA